MGEIDARDRALLAIEREGLSHEALFAGALANLSEPLVIFAGSHRHCRPADPLAPATT